MIITDIPASDLKHRQIESRSEPVTQAEPLQSPPPPYNTRESPGALLIPKDGSLALTRFFQAFCLAIAIYTALGVAVFFVRQGSTGDEMPAQPIADDGIPTLCHIPWESHSAPPLDTSPHWNFEHPRPHALVSLGKPTPIEPPQPSGTPKPYPKYSARTSLELPLNSSGIYLLARGEIYGGSVHLVTYEPEHGEAKIRVGMHLTYWDLEAINRVNICMLKKNGEDGIGLYFPSKLPVSPGHVPLVWMSVTLAFPASTGSPLLLKSLRTNLPSFEHKIGNLKELVYFDTLSMRAPHATINAMSVQAGQLTVETTDGQITGEFNTCHSLALITTNAIIEADVGIHSTNEQGTTVLNLRTSNAHIKANVSVYPASERSTEELGSLYRVNTETTNGKVVLNFPTLPIGSTLDVNSKTSNAAIEANLNPVFQGSFDISTTNAELSVGYQEKTPDPSGRGRTRWMLGKSAPGLMRSGEVWWGDKESDTKGGNIDLKTSNGYIRLEFD